MVLEAFGNAFIFYLVVVFNCIFYLFFSADSEHGPLDLISFVTGLDNYSLLINMFYIKHVLCEFKEE